MLEAGGLRAAPWPGSSIGRWRIIFLVCKQAWAAVADRRRRKGYSQAELIMGGVTMFLFQEGSRNRANQDRVDVHFQDNYRRLFGYRMPHLDTVDEFLRALPEQELEDLKALLVSELIRRKVFHPHRFEKEYLLVAVDGTGLGHYVTDYCGACLSKKHTGKPAVYFHYVLEAKLVSASGLAISLATEWVENDPARNFNKQDCEQVAFGRLAAKLKRYFPQEKLLILADGLYPTDPFFTLCRSYQWPYVVTLKDGNLKTLQEEIRLLPPQTHHHTEHYSAGKGWRQTESYTWTDDIPYKSHTLYWAECKEALTFTGQEKGRWRNKKSALRPHYQPGPGDRAASTAAVHRRPPAVEDRKPGL